MRETSLVIFTLSAQTSAGAYVILAVLQLIGSEEVFILPVIAILGMLLGLALLAAFFHLGSPRQAYLVLSNLRSSWLSREILAVSLFGCLLLVQGILAVTGLQPPRLLTVLAALSALALVSVMGQAYMLPALPLWNSPVTILSFFAASILLGGGLVLLINLKTEEFSKYIIILMELAVLVELGLSVWRYRLRSWARSKSLRRVGDIHRPGEAPVYLHNIHFRLLLFVGALIGMSQAFQSAHFLLIGPVFLLALIGQIAGRVLFYQAGLGERR